MRSLAVDVHSPLKLFHLSTLRAYKNERNWLMDVWPSMVDSSLPLCVLSDKILSYNAYSNVNFRSLP